MTRNNDTTHDPVLGGEIALYLNERGVESPFSTKIQSLVPTAVTYDMIRQNVESILSLLGLDLNNDSIARTPERVAKMFIEEAFRGLDYSNFPRCTTIENHMKVDEMIIVRDISVQSMCEHHLVAFTGNACVGYIPKTRLLGLSKFNRVVDFFSRRPQVQERLTEQVYHALSYILDTDDVAVVIECAHHCVKLRGVRDVNSETVTSKMGGRFLSKPEARAEFLTLARR
jgi:GTP cyclohydrolase I